MSLKVGRCGADVTLVDPSSWEAQGDRASVAGFLSAATQADVNVLREQLLGYADNPDEEVVPVTWTVDSRVDGFYRVLGVQVSEDPGHRVAKTLPYRLELERVPSYASTVSESVFVDALRTNNKSVTTGRSLMGFPASVESILNGPFIATVIDRDSADGDVQVWLHNITSTGGSGTARFSTAPANHYLGGAKFESGTTLRTVVGKQLPISTNWRLSNGLVRVVPAAGAFDTFDVSFWTGTAWESSTPVALFREAVSPQAFAIDTVSVTVLRNSPEQVAIRVYMSTGTTALDTRALAIDLSLRRGDRNVHIHSTSFFRLAVTDGLTAVSLTGGLRRDANDADGNRWVLASANGTLATTNPHIVNINGVDAALGIEVNGSAATGQEAAQQIVNQYFGAISDRVVTVGF